MFIYILDPRAVIHVRQHLSPLDQFQRSGVEHKKAAVLARHDHDLLFTKVCNHWRAADVDIEIRVAVIALRRHLKESPELAGSGVERE
jgi:hypothetical protein